MSAAGIATVLPDSEARIAALTDHERTLLVEAGAGSGKDRAHGRAGGATGCLGRTSERDRRHHVHGGGRCRTA